MKRLAKFEATKADLLAKIDAVLEAASANEDGRFTDEQQKELDGLKARLASTNAMIEEQKRLDAEERAAPAIYRREPIERAGRVTGLRHRSEDDVEAHGFQGHRDFLLAVRDNAHATRASQVQDERLQPLAIGADGGAGLAFGLPLAFTPSRMRAAVGSDEQNTAEDQHGGYMVRETILPGLLQVGADADPTRTQPIPMETRTVKITARNDKDHSSSLSGGLTVGRRTEMQAFAASRSKIERISLSAAMLAGLSFETEELLQDSMSSFIAIIDAGFRTEFPGRKFEEKLRGTGGDQYLGILTALAASNLGPTIAIPKETGQAAASIVAQNVIKMRARCWRYSDAIWLANHDCYPQLATMSLPVGVAGQLVYQQSSVVDRPDLLLGRPIVYTEFAETVGTQGDLILSNWSQYLEGIYRPLQSASSVHVRFETHEQTFKFWEENAGAPWWRVPLTPKKGSNTLSPFVVLATRS